MDVTRAAAPISTTDSVGTTTPVSPIDAVVVVERKSGGTISACIAAINESKSLTSGSDAVVIGEGPGFAIRAAAMDGDEGAAVMVGALTTEMVLASASAGAVGTRMAPVGVPKRLLIIESSAALDSSEGVGGGNVGVEGSGCSVRATMRFLAISSRSDSWAMLEVEVSGAPGVGSRS